MKKNDCMKLFCPPDRIKKWLILMKLILIFFFIGLSQVNAAVYGQEEIVSFQSNKLSIGEVLRTITRQLKYDIFFSDDELDTSKEIIISNKKLSVENILQEILQDKASYEFVDKTIIIKPLKQTMQPQDEIRLYGVVRDKTGVVLPGVAVLIKGTTTGVSTDIEGKFVMVLPKMQGITLVFSCVGMEKKEVLYTGQKNIEVTMTESVTEMNEVVVTGYQVIDKRKLTSAVSSVRAEDIIHPGLFSIDQALEGRIPDMILMTNSGEVGIVPKIRIRGTSTLIGNREPLWVLDGIVLTDPVPVNPYELNDPDYINRIGNAIAGINPQDIDRIDVLKDASATALYGAKAANGVIVITTKKGYLGKPIVSYNLSTSVKRRPHYSDRKINLMDSKERIAFSRDLVNSRYIFPTDINMVGYEGAYTRLYNGEIGYDEFTREVGRLETENTDWFDLLTENAFSHQHTVSISGGTQDIRYYSSLGYTKDDDVIRGNKNERYTASVKLNANLSKIISATLGINGNVGTRDYYQDANNPMDYAYNTSRAIPAYNEDRTEYLYTRMATTTRGYKFNILNELDNSSYNQNNSGLSFNANIDFKFTDYLNAQAILSYATSNTEIEDYWGEKTWYAANLRRSEYAEEAPKGESSESTMPFGGQLTKNYVRNNSYTVRLQINLNKYFGQEEKHNINASVGYEIGSSRYNGYRSQMRGYYPERGKRFATGISLSDKDYPAYQTWMSNNAYPTLTDNLQNLLSGYLTVSYSYKNLFTLNANTRIDGSNKFGSRSNEKLLPIWSVSGNYNLSEHIPTGDIVDHIRLKVSYGYQGNMLDGQSPVMIIKKNQLDSYYNEFTADVAAYPNPNLRWEKTSSLNTGLEFSLFKNRLQVNGSYYYKYTKDAFLQKQISTVNGRTEYVINSGNITNSGYSVDLQISPVRNKHIVWTLATSWSKVFNKMKTLPGADQYELSNFLNGTALVKDEAIGTFYSYPFLGLNPLDGGPMFDDMQDRKEELYGKSKYETYTTILKPSGLREPTISGGINNTLKYKGFMFNMNLAYSLGAKTRLFRMYNSSSNFRPEMNVRREFMDHWNVPGDELRTDIPAIIGQNSGAYEKYRQHYSVQNFKMNQVAWNVWDMYDYGDHRVVSANYLKCTNLGLTYEIPEKFLRQFNMSRLALTGSVSNLFVICSRELKGQTPVQGGFMKVQLSERPTYALGINVSF